MSQRNEDLARLYFAKFPHDDSLVDEALDDAFVMHHLRDIVGPDEFRAFMHGVSRAFPDFRFEMHHVVTGDGLVAAHYTFAGTQADTFLGSVPARGRSFSTRGMSVFHFSAGRIDELWVAFNSLAMLQQLGAVGPVGDEL